MGWRRVGWNGGTMIGTVIVGFLSTAGMACAAISCLDATRCEIGVPFTVAVGFTTTAVCALICFVGTLHAVVSGETAPSLTDNHIEYRVCEGGVCTLARRIDCEAP